MIFSKTPLGGLSLTAAAAQTKDMPRHRVTLRRATRRDVGGILNLINEWYREEGENEIPALSSRIMKSCFGRGRTDFLIVAEDDDGLAGYAYIHPMYDIGIEEPHLILEGLFVTKPKRSLGIGAKLMSAAARLAKQEQAIGLIWIVHKRNRRGIKFYKSQGAEKSEFDTLFITGSTLTARARRVAEI